MANNYTQASIIVPATREQAEYLVELLGAEDSDGMAASCRTEIGEEGVWISAEETFDVDRVASDVHSMLLNFDLPTVVWLEWADVCSKPRIGEFSGGGVRITKEGLEWFLPYQMYRQKYPNDVQA